MKAKVLILSLLLAATAVTAACENTMRGVGRDTERAGETIQRKAQ